MQWSSFQCFCITSMLLSYVCPYVLLYVYECACSDLPLSSAPLFLCCADSLPPSGFRSAKLQSVGQHWSAAVWGLPPARQLGLPGQQLQLYPGWTRGRGGTSFTGDEPPTPPQRTRGILDRETVRRKVDADWNTCAHYTCRTRSATVVCYGQNCGIEDFFCINSKIKKLQWTKNTWKTH